MNINDFQAHEDKNRKELDLRIKLQGREYF